MVLKSLGYILLLLSCISFLLVFFVPFLTLSTSEKASLAGALYVFCEITWWLAVPLLGKEMLAWLKQLWFQLTLFKSKNSTETFENRELDMQTNYSIEKDLAKDTQSSVVSGKMAFTREEDVSEDTERKKLKRASAKNLYGNVKEEFNFIECQFHDCLASSAPSLNLETMGFDTIDLSQSAELQEVLEQVRVASSVEDEQAALIRKLIKGRSYRLSNGKTLRFLFVAPEGFIMRQAGPNGLKINPSAHAMGSNGHDGAMTVHGDQDVFGTPLKQILKGFAPKLFRHKTPDGENKKSPIFLVNIWIPLQQITRPLTLMDRRTLDNKNHQLRYALPTDSFLERKKDQVNNDIWAFLHDEKQTWYFHSEMNPTKAYVFDTLGEPHGAFILPGEKRAEALYKKLSASVEALEKNDIDSLQKNTALDFVELPSDTTLPLRAAISNMENLLGEANRHAEKLLTNSERWNQQAKQAMDSVVRKSIEMRVVGLVTSF